MNRKERRAMLSRRNRMPPPTNRQRRQAQLAKLRRANPMTDAGAFLNSPLASLPPSVTALVAQAEYPEDFDLLE